MRPLAELSVPRCRFERDDETGALGPQGLNIVYLASVALVRGGVGLLRAGGGSSCRRPSLLPTAGCCKLFNSALPVNRTPPASLVANTALPCAPPPCFPSTLQAFAVGQPASSCVDIIWPDEFNVVLMCPIPNLCLPFPCLLSHAANVPRCTGRRLRPRVAVGCTSARRTTPSFSRTLQPMPRLQVRWQLQSISWCCFYCFLACVLCQEGSSLLLQVRMAAASAACQHVFTGFMLTLTTSPHGCLPPPRCAAGGFDMIVDDGSHAVKHIWATLNALWPSVKPGGVYVIEDLVFHWSEPHKWSSFTTETPATLAVPLFQRLIHSVNCLSPSTKLYSEDYRAWCRKEQADSIFKCGVMYCAVAVDSNSSTASCCPVQTKLCHFHTLSGCRDVVNVDCMPEACALVKGRPLADL